MKACIAGYGGIGKNVYHPILKDLGFDVIIIDPFAPEADYLDVTLSEKDFDIAIVSAPNCFHYNIVEELAPYTKRILVEKPGFRTAAHHEEIVSRFRDTCKISMVKNNLYRNLSQEGLTRGIWAQIAMGNFDGVKSIDLRWLHKNRVPNAGNWSTNKRYSWGGVALDLFPHLYCLFFLVTNRGKYFPDWMNLEQAIDCEHKQTVFLKDLVDSDYGTVNKDGVFNVSNYAKQRWHPWGSLPVTVNFEAAWAGDTEEQSVTIVMNDKTEHKWHFGLCPEDAYREMILSFMTDSLQSGEWYDHQFDANIHSHLAFYTEISDED